MKSRPKSAKSSGIDQKGALALAQSILHHEAKSILNASKRLNGSFSKSLSILATSLEKGGKIVVTGMGKSGKVAAKVAATLCSTGSLAIYLHPSEAAHGDLGVVADGDAVLVFSHSGNSDELLLLFPFFKRLRIPIISILGQMNSPIALESDAVLDASVSQEACPLNLAPTASTTVALALGDALALCLSNHWGFHEDDFAMVHPAGALGRRLHLRIKDLMKDAQNTPWVSLNAGMDEVVSMATKYPLGGVLVHEPIPGSKKLTKKLPFTFAGLITEGDIRRALRHKEKFFDLAAKDIMTKNPTRVSVDDKASDVLLVMEKRSSQISVAPVFDGENCVGLIRLHDLVGLF